MPAVGVSNPAIRRRQVVLPDPDGPSIEKNSPSATRRSTSSTAVKEPKRLVTPSRLDRGDSTVSTPPDVASTGSATWPRIPPGR